MCDVVQRRPRGWHALIVILYDTCLYFRPQIFDNGATAPATGTFLFRDETRTTTAIGFELWRTHDGKLDDEARWRPRWRPRRRRSRRRRRRRHRRRRPRPRPHPHPTPYTKIFVVKRIESSNEEIANAWNNRYEGVSKFIILINRIIAKGMILHKKIKIENKILSSFKTLFLEYF